MTLKQVCAGMCLSLLLGAAPACALMLGGAEVPKEKMIVYLLIGHSNMAGIDLANSDPVSIPQAWNYPMATKQWVPAKEPRGNKATAGLSGHGSGGPGMPFLKGMAAAHPGYYFGVLTNASPSSTCRGENTGSNGSGLDPEDNRYWDSTYLFDQIISAAKAVQKDVTFGGILCMLGSVEATRTSETVCRAFSDDIAGLAKAMRRELGLPNLPFIMGEYEAGASGTFSTSLPLPKIIAEQGKLIPSKLPFSATVNTVGIPMMDDHHFSATQGQPEWAKRAMALIEQNKWFPGAGAGVLARPLRKDGRLHGPWSAARPGLMILETEEGAWFADGKAYQAPLAVKER